MYDATGCVETKRSLLRYVNCNMDEKSEMKRGRYRHENLCLLYQISAAFLPPETKLHGQKLLKRCKTVEIQKETTTLKASFVWGYLFQKLTVNELDLDIRV
ncbi:hypothetical protein CHARACLAT_005847 [Characodon lateralis]|uniref:Uncharacterized protein n=1 Tax=Characodon lateralis TaxID=208331 RepID=A0ABU7F2X1_9TELE|nr:hypothetical protein [Characodon lateralis]